MVFNLAGLHLGDVLLAAPCMRRGDSVIVGKRHRVPGLPVSWLDAGTGVSAHVAHGRHMTDAWMRATGREAVRHEIQPALPKRHIVIAPDVAALGKRWHGWADLRRALPQAIIVGADMCRAGWMALLNTAHTVICPDTGTAHMADALGCRVVGLYGRQFETFAPFWDRSHCVARDGMASITVRDVLEAVHG